MDKVRVNVGVRFRSLTFYSRAQCYIACDKTTQDKTLLNNTNPDHISNPSCSNPNHTHLHPNHSTLHKLGLEM